MHEDSKLWKPFEDRQIKLALEEATEIDIWTKE